MRNVCLTKNRAGKKMFYYAHLLMETAVECQDQATVNPHGTANSPHVWLTINLGWIPDGGTELAASQDLYLGGDGPVFGEVLATQETNHLRPELCQAIHLAQARLEARIRKSLCQMHQWLGNPAGSIPVLSTRDFAALKQLKEFTSCFFDDGYTSSVAGQDPDIDSTTVNFDAEWVAIVSLGRS